MKKRLIMLLTLCLVAALFPVTAFAQTGDKPITCTIGGAKLGEFDSLSDLYLALMDKMPSTTCCFAENIVVEISENITSNETFYVPAMADGYSFTIKSSGQTASTISNASIYVNGGANLILKNIVLDGSGSYNNQIITVASGANGYFSPAKDFQKATVTLGNGAVIQNGYSFAMYGAIAMTSSTDFTPKLIMQDGGKISGCYRGVWLDASFGGTVEFEMTGGSIENNSYGGGVLVGKNVKFTMTGGSITNNTGAEWNSGGISIHGGSVTIGGDAKVINNGAGGNIMFNEWTDTFIVQENFTGKVGVTSSSNISGNGKKPITVAGSSAYQQAYINGNIFSDVTKYDVLFENNALYLALHQHNWIYTANGASISAACTGVNCSGISGGSVTLLPPSGTLLYDGNAHKASLSGSFTTNLILSKNNISYTYAATENGDYQKTNDFTKAGYYKASVTVPNNDGTRVTATLAYHVAKAVLQNAPDAPTMESRTETSIVLEEQNGCEYSMDGITWQAEATFEGLSPNTEYVFYARFAETENYAPSTASDGTALKTIAPPVPPNSEDEPIPETGDSMALFMLIGASLLSMLGMAVLKKQKQY